MKKIAVLLLLTALMLLSCGQTSAPKPISADEVLSYMSEQNALYIKADDAVGNVSDARREDTAQNGQHPYAVVITCSDSRVPPEHIFRADIGDLFVIRTAGNVIGQYELGSVEYGAEHLGCKVVLVLGHTHCGAVDAALNGGAHGNIASITNEILSCLPEGCDAREAEVINVRNSIEAIMESPMMQELVAEHGVTVKGAIYDIDSGAVSYLD